MCRRLCAILTIAAALASVAPGAYAQYEAPWSSFDFLQDQAWSQINNRLANQRMADLRDSANGKDKREDAPAPKPKAAAPAASRAALNLGPGATTDLAPLRPYLKQIQLTESQAAKMLAMYSQVAGSLDVPANDTASGIAAFLAGSYAAYANTPFPDAYYKPLYEQFARNIGSDQALVRKPLAERREYYQRLVVAGMIYQLLQLELQNNRKPDQVATMRKAAGNAFAQIAGVSPDRIRFTATGLTARSRD